MNFKHILLFIFFYLLALLMTLPAAAVIGFIPNNSGVTVASAAGTLWRGKAEQLTVKNKYHLRQVSWDIDWLALASLQFKLDLTFNNGSTGASGKGNILFGLEGLTVQDFILDVSAAELLSYINLPLPIKASGSLSLIIKNASQGSPYCQQLDGYLIWQNAVINSEMGNIDLQSAHINLRCDEGQINADLQQDSEQINSTINLLLKEGGIYQLQGLLKGSDKLDPKIKQVLPWIGAKNSAGATVVSFQGKL